MYLQFLDIKKIKYLILIDATEHRTFSCWGHQQYFQQELFDNFPS